MESFLTKSKIVSINRKIREWEQKNLPIYGSSAGYDLFMELASLKENSQARLKHLYLSLDHSESTTRLLLRNLEEDGWIEVVKNGQDRRHRSFRRTAKLDEKIQEWVEVINAIIYAGSEHRRPPHP